MGHIVFTLTLLLMCFVSIHSRFIHQCPPSGCITKSQGVNVEPLSLDLSNNRKVQNIETRKFKSQQYYKDVKIYGASLVIYEDEDSLQTPLFGNWYSQKELEALVPDVTPTISVDDALAIALNALSITSDDIIQTVDSELNIWFDSTKGYLAYMLRFVYRNITDTKHMYRPLAVVHAQSGGKLLYLSNTPYGRPMVACGTAGNGRIGKYKYCDDIGGTWIKKVGDKWTPKLQHYDYAIYDHNNKVWSSSYKQKFKCARNTLSDSCDADAYDATVNGGYGTGIDAYHHTKVTWNMYKEWMGEKPIYWPKPFPIYVHVGSNWANAFFTTDGAIYIGDGDNQWHPHVALDTLAHEIAHGYTHRYSNLEYSGQSGGMDEAYSDMVAVAAWNYNRGWTKWKDFKIGYYERRWGSSPPNDALRYMYNPPLDGYSIKHKCDFSWNMDVHESSGIYNYAVFWLNRKSSIRKWSMEEIFKVWSTANKYWTVNSTFRQGLCGIIQALGAVYGSKSDVELMEAALTDAFDRVGVNCYSSTNC